MEHHLDFLYLANAKLHEDDIVEIDENLEWANEERFKKQLLEIKIKTAVAKLEILEIELAHTANTYAKNKINQIIKTLK